jgi:Tfp pilus assembly protein PilV
MVSNPLPGSPRRRRPDSGFTILEVSMATFVMAMGIATSIVAMQSGFKTIDVARGTTIASQILQSEMERLRLKSWSDLTTMANATDTVAPMPTGSPAGVEMFDGATNFTSSTDVSGKFIVTRTIAADSARPSDVYNITITVTWQTYTGRTLTRTFKSMYAKNGLYDYYYTLARP